MIKFLAKLIVKNYHAQHCFCYCPGCGLELCNSQSWFSDTDLMRFKCIKCGTHSEWNFDMPAPFLLTYKEGK